MLWVVPVLFGIACAVALWLSAHDPTARLLARCLLVVWALANAAWVYNMMWLLPVFDLGLGVAAIALWWATRAKWVALIADAVAIRLILHVLDGLSGHLFEVSYIHALNATFAWMLVLVASSGGGHVRDTLFRRFRRLRGRLSIAQVWRMSRGC